MKKYIIILSILFLISTRTGFAIGISPTSQIINFSPNSNISSSFRIHNSNSELLNIRLKASGDLSEYVSFPEETYKLEPNEWKSVFYNLEFPSKLKPGKYILRVGPVEVGNGRGMIGAVVGVEMIVTTVVPYPSKYIDVGISIQKNITENIQDIILSISSLGNETVFANGKLSVYDYYNSTIFSEDIEEMEFKPNTTIVIQKQLKTENLKHGLYRIEITFNYDDIYSTYQNHLSIGSPEIEIINIKNDFVKQEEDGKLIVFLKNNYLGDISNIYTKLHVKDKIIQSEPLTIGPSEKINITTNYTTTNMEYGIYKANLDIFYGKTSLRKEIKIYILPKNIEYLFVGIIMFILLCIILFIHFRGRKK